VSRFPLVSVEDPLGDDDWEAWSTLTGRLSGIQIIGDDLFATNASRLRRGVEAGAASAVLAKLNQNGTVSGTAEVVRHAHAAGYHAVVSARSGETEDSSIADLAVGWRAGQIKVGSVTRSERTAKWNRLLRIEAELGATAEFAGAEALRSGLR
jgi:enolase